jgi:60 kDa SS-A/Ro ribonucleoprotein
MSYAKLVDRALVPQRERLDDRQVRNNAGGFVFALDAWGRLDRFLILGSDQPTYYQSAPKLTRENARAVVECWKADHARTAGRVAEISASGRAPKNSPAIFALALGATDDDVDVRRSALGAVSRVCRTASHLFELAALIEALGRGFGRSVARAIASWYEDRPAEKLAYQMTKYRVRDDYSHKRLIQRCHPKAADGDPKRVALYRWACNGGLGHVLPDLVLGHIAAMKTDDPKELVSLVEKHGLTWEQVPTWALTHPVVWEAMLPNLGMTALLRNLGTLTDLGVVKPLGARTLDVIGRLTDPEQVRRSRLHPYAILNALAVYRSGRSVKGERRWTPVPAVEGALDEAFYLGFGNVEPTGRRWMLGLDVSGSMASSFIGGVLSAREASAAMSMATARAERQHHFIGFSQGVTNLGITPRMSLPETVRVISGLPHQSTDCAAPMIHALKAGLEVDVFAVYTDNETHCGSVHPREALRRYRRETGIDAKLVVAGMTATGFSIADPDDRGMLDVVGFDADAVSLMADFART